jgi:hypothetical protein
MNILEIAQSAADICAVARPTDLFNSTAQNDQLFASVVNSTLDSLMRHAPWQCLTREATLYTSDGVKDYLIDNVAPDFYSLINGTMYIKDDMRDVIGAITEEKWRQLKQYHTAEIMLFFKVQNNMFRFVKNPRCLKLKFAYKSNAVCMDAKTGEPKSRMTANTDIPVFDPYLVKLGIIWRWNKRTGLDYSEEYNEYERELNKSYAESKALGDINLSYTYGIFDDPNGGVIVDAKCESCCEV